MKDSCIKGIPFESELDWIRGSRLVLYGLTRAMEDREPTYGGEALRHEKPMEIGIRD